MRLDQARIFNLIERGNGTFPFFRDGTFLLALRLFIFKLSYWAILLLCVMRWGSFGGFFPILDWPQTTTRSYTTHFIVFDGAFYLSIAQTGYHTGNRDCAFYPLWPAVCKLLSWIPDVNLVVAGLLLANLFSLVGWLLIYRITSKKFGTAAASWALAFLLLFPGSIFYQFLYSESLFLFLLALLWWGLETGKLWPTLVAAFLLPLTRPIGVFCFLPILWQILSVSPPNWLKRKPGFYRLLGDQHYASQTDSSLRGWWLVLIPFCGWICYLLLMFVWTGNAFEGFVVQKYWGTNSVSHLWNLPKFFISWFTPDSWHAYRGSLLDRAVFTILVYCMPLIWKLDKRLIMWTYFLGIIPAMSGEFTSYTRYASSAFPLFIALGVFFAPQSRRWEGFGLLGIFAILQISLVWRYVNFQWAG